MVPEDGDRSYTCMVIKQEGGDLVLCNSDNYVRFVLEATTCAGHGTLAWVDLRLRRVEIEKGQVSARSRFAGYWSLWLEIC
jgi:hypothetical protein